MQQWIVCSFYTILLACSQSNTQADKSQVVINETPEHAENTSLDTAKLENTVSDTPSEYNAYERNLMEQGFQDVETIPNVFIDLKYATSDNFTNQLLYDSLHHAFLHPISYDKLKKASELLQEKHSNYGFLVYDALRPNHVQYKMWDIVKGTEKERYVASPKSGSIHNFGFAIDLTIIDLTTMQAIAMGSDYDYFGPEAEYRYNNQLLLEKRLSQEEVNNRILLRQILRQAGFHSIDTEWWHFNALTRTETRRNYSMIY